MTSKKVAITFDDGPNPPYTNQILEILKKEKIRATFFVCGANIKRHPETVKKVAKEGHIVGNHTYYHFYPTVILGAIYQEVQKTQKMIDDLIGVQKYKYFRSPGFLAPGWIKARLKDVGFEVWGGVVGNDWEPNMTPQQIADRI